jgi:hypothetical protein
MTIKETIIDLSDNYYDNNESSIEGAPVIESLYYPCQEAIVQAPGAPELPGGCPEGLKYSGDTIGLQASPNDGIGPYHVRFWRLPAAGGSMSYGEIGSVRLVSEGSSTSTSFTLYDTDLVAASGKTNAGFPDTDVLGNITAPNDSTAPLGIGKIRVATTVYDSCPISAKSCISTCDIALGCVAPTCNFTVM